MAKGLGSIMTMIEMDHKRSILTDAEGVACPLCGGLMSFNGVRWFCYSDPETSKCPQMRALEDAMYKLAPQEYRLKGNYNNIFQGQLFAAVVVDGRPIIEFGSIRGGQGRTNLFVGRLGDTPREEVPDLIQKYGWTWYDWIPDELKA